jgi:hypothetical protein
MTNQKTMPFIRLNDITRMNEEIRTRMYTTLQLDWNHNNTKRLLVERVHDAGGVDRTVRMVDLNAEEVAHCRTLRIYDR